MKKLELKHIAPYLAYGVKCFCTEFNNGEILTLESFYFSSSSKELKLIFKEKNGGSSSTSCKPILRPLSQLTQEIEHNGGKFVPMDILHELFRKTDLFYFDTYMVLNNPYEVIEKLLEWHFDVFGLIEQELAIEKL